MKAGLVVLASLCAQSISAFVVPPAGAFSAGTARRQTVRMAVDPRDLVFGKDLATKEVDCGATAPLGTLRVPRTNNTRC